MRSCTHFERVASTLLMGRRYTWCLQKAISSKGFGLSRNLSRNYHQKQRFSFSNKTSRAEGLAFYDWCLKHKWKVVKDLTIHLMVNFSTVWLVWTIQWFLPLIRCHFQPLVTFGHSWLEMAPRESQKPFHFLNTSDGKQILIFFPCGCSLTNFLPQ